MPYFVYANCTPLDKDKALDSSHVSPAEWDSFYARAVSDMDAGVMPEAGIKTVMSSGEVIEGDPGDKYNITGLTTLKFENIDEAVEHAKTYPLLKFGGALMVSPYTKNPDTA